MPDACSLHKIGGGLQLAEEICCKPIGGDLYGVSMLLREYIDAKGRGEISRLVRETGCAGSTIHDVLNGKPIAKFATAQKIAAATGGLVSAESLCGPQEIKKPGRTRRKVEPHASSLRATKREPSRARTA